MHLLAGRIGDRDIHFVLRVLSASAFLGAVPGAVYAGREMLTTSIRLREPNEREQAAYRVALRGEVRLYGLVLASVLAVVTNVSAALESKPTAFTRWAGPAAALLWVVALIFFALSRRRSRRATAGDGEPADAGV